MSSGSTMSLYLYLLLQSRGALNILLNYRLLMVASSDVFNNTVIRAPQEIKLSVQVKLITTNKETVASEGETTRLAS